MTPAPSPDPFAIVAGPAHCTIVGLSLRRHYMGGELHVGSSAPDLQRRTRPAAWPNKSQYLFMPPNPSRLACFGIAQFLPVRAGPL